MGTVQDCILSEKEIFVGLEDSKRTWRLCVRSLGVIVHQTSMPARYEILRNYFLNKFPQCAIHVMYEAGFSGFSLHDRIEQDNWHCIVTPPHTVTEPKCQRQKNDRIDCRRLAKNLENRDYHVCYVPDQTLREDRQVARTYRIVQRDIVKACNRIRRTIEFHGLDPYFPAGQWSKKYYQMAQQQLKKMSLSSSLQFSFQILFSQLHHLWQLKKDLLKQLKTLAKNDRYRLNVDLLKSAPGIGWLTAIRLALEWGQVNRFKNKAHFSSFLGLIPSEYSSGEQERKGHITKQGNRAVRSWLVESSWVAIRYDPVLLDKYQRVYRSCGSKKKAIVAVARKLAIRLRTLLLTGQPYVIGTAA